jgi:ATP-dependent helicase/nuclease subunit B
VPIELITGPANAGKAQLALDAVRTRAARGEQPLLVVPTEADRSRYRRELAQGGLVLGATVERFEGLLAEIVRRAALGEQALGRFARARALALAARELPEPGADPPHSAGAGLARALGETLAELSGARVTPRRLRGALTSRAGGHPQLERLLAAFEAYERILARLGRVDRETLLVHALDELRRRPAIWGATAVVLYGFDSFTELQLDAIETLGAVVDAPVTVSLAYEPGRVAFADRAGTYERLRPQASAHTALPARAEYYEQRSRPALHHLERSLFSEQPARAQAGSAVRLLEGGSPRAELELVAGEIRALLDEGVEPWEIVIVHRAPASVQEPLSDILEEHSVPHVRPARERFSQTALGRGLIGLLRCARGDGSLGDLLAWMRAPGVIRVPSLVDRLEAQARRSGALSAGQARTLWEAEHWPLDRIDRVAQACARGSLALLRAVAAELEQLFAEPRRRLAHVLEHDEIAEAGALNGARRALEELREVARGAAELAPDLPELTRLLEDLDITGPAPGAEDAVSLLHPLSLRARRVRVLFLCGMCESVFPRPSRPRALLAEHERRRLALESGLVLPAEPDALAAERYLLYAIASRPQERLTLSWHAADDDGAPLARSLFIDDVCDLFAQELQSETRRRAAGAADWPGPGGPPELRAGRRPAPPIAPIAPLGDRRVLAELRGRELWSASGIEAWASCPVKWFVERWLFPGELEPSPEPMARGSLAHAALRETLERLRTSTGSARLTPASLGLAKRLLRESLADAEASNPLSVAPERVPGARRRLQADLERYLEQAALAEGPLEPTHFELEFGFEGSELPAFELGDRVMLRGRIDRVDVGPDGQAVVYDYKTKAAPPAGKWLERGALQVALYMSAVERLLGNRAVGGFYQPLSGAQIKARGALEKDAGVELDCVRTDRMGSEEMAELLERCRRAALEAVQQARAGALEPRPATCGYNGGCSYPAICRCTP